MQDSGRRLAVLGSPIGHSKSPALHRAAYRELGLDWDYEAVEVDSADLAGFVRSRGSEWRGLSLTMPLKREVQPLLDDLEPLAARTGSANTLLFDDAGGERRLRGFNTDVYGIAAAFRKHGHDTLGFVHVLGGGATAASAIAAVGTLGARRVLVSVRSPERADALVALGSALDIEVTIGALADAATPDSIPDAIISTLPNGAEHSLDFDDATVERTVLFDVAYSPWPTTLAARWIAGTNRPHAIIGGLEMLVLQALVQVRIFVNGEPHLTLPNEDAVLAAMYASVGLSPGSSTGA
jgi:shikimate dehydrogenase